MNINTPCLYLLQQPLQCCLYLPLHSSPLQHNQPLFNFHFSPTILLTPPAQHKVLLLSNAITFFSHSFRVCLCCLQTVICTTTRHGSSVCTPSITGKSSLLSDRKLGSKEKFPIMKFLLATSCKVLTVPHLALGE